MPTLSSVTPCHPSRGPIPTETRKGNAGHVSLSWAHSPGGLAAPCLGLYAAGALLASVVGLHEVYEWVRHS